MVSGMSTSDKPTAVFVADAHFHLEPDAAERHRRDRFLSFLGQAAGVPDVFLLGDIFDFWFDYPHFRLRGYDAILAALDTVRDAGSRLHFVGGNHDIWAAGYLHERYGSSPDGEPFVVEREGLRIHLTHGDGLLGRDWIYSTFRKLVRARAGIVLAKSLHPELLYALSTWLSGHSRTATRDEAEEIAVKARRWLARLHDPAWDLLIMGHMHHPLDVEHAGRRLVTLAGWFDPLGYAVLRNGRLTLAEYPHSGTVPL
jgi:UDP-2,3-diacylglucosamine hydrolase